MRTVLVATLLLAVAVPAAAHVGVAPRQSTPGAKETYTLRVPTEGKTATTSVVLDVPEGVTVPSATAPEGGTYDMARVAGRVISVTWTVTIPPGSAAQLSFQAQNPAAASEIVWPVHQKYADGTSSEWIGPAGTRGPAPVTRLTSAPATQSARAATPVANGPAPFDGPAVTQGPAGARRAGFSLRAAPKAYRTSLPTP